MEIMFTVAYQAGGHNSPGPTHFSPKINVSYRIQRVVYIIAIGRYY